MGEKIVITGIGCISPYGIGVNKLWERLKNNEIQLETTINESLYKENLQSYLTSKQIKYLDKQQIFSLIAVKEALEDANLFNQNIILENMNVIAGVMFPQIEFGINQVKKLVIENSWKISPYTGLAFYLGQTVGEISIKYKLKGEGIAILTDVTSFIDGVGFAFKLIKDEIWQKAIVVSGERGGDKVVQDSFRDMGLFSKKGKYLPYHINRNGFITSDGGVGVVIEKWSDECKKRRSSYYCEIIAYESLTTPLGLFSCNITNLIETGEFLINRLLRGAGISPEKIDLYFGIAEGTEQTDFMESCIIKKIWNNYSSLKLTSSKSKIGHTLSCSGGFDIISSILIFKNKLYFPMMDNFETDLNIEKFLFFDFTTYFPSYSLLLSKSIFEGRLSALLIKNEVD